MALTKNQVEQIRASLMLYHDYSRNPTGYLRLVPLETDRFPHGISIGVSVTREDQEQVKAMVVDYLADFVEDVIHQGDDVNYIHKLKCSLFELIELCKRNKLESDWRVRAAKELIRCTVQGCGLGGACSGKGTKEHPCPIAIRR